MLDDDGVVGDVQLFPLHGLVEDLCDFVFLEGLDDLNGGVLPLLVDQAVLDGRLVEQLGVEQQLGEFGALQLQFLELFLGYFV